MIVENASTRFRSRWASARTAPQRAVATASISHGVELAKSAGSAPRSVNTSANAATSTMPITSPPITAGTDSASKGIQNQSGNSPNLTAIPGRRRISASDGLPCSAAIVPPIIPTADNSTAARYAFRAPAVFALRQTASSARTEAASKQVARARVPVARMPAHARIPAAAKTGRYARVALAAAVASRRPASAIPTDAAKPLQRQHRSGSAALVWRRQRAMPLPRRARLVLSARQPASIRARSPATPAVAPVAHRPRHNASQ